jgi:uncharacterized protein (DUF58 family)
MAKPDANQRDIIAAALKVAESLRLAAPLHTDGYNGRLTGRGAGNALEFAEYREYRPGDDLRRLDWFVHARTEQWMVRQFSEEIEPRCDILLDESASMGISPLKTAAAWGLAALLAKAADNGGFTLRVWHLGALWQRETRPLEPLEWDCVFQAPVSPGQTVSGFPNSLQKRGIRLVISDLLWPEAPEAFLHTLCQDSRRVCLLQLRSAEDAPPHPQKGLWTLIDAENGEKRNLSLDSATCAAVAQRLKRHDDQWDAACRTHGAILLSLSAENLAANWDLLPLAKAKII